MGKSIDEVASVGKAFAILGLFHQKGELGVTEIANSLDMAKGSVHRFLTSLKRLGMIDQDANTSRYRPGVGMLELANIYLTHLEWPKAIRPFLERLSQKVQGETVHLAVRDRTKIIYVDKIEGKHLLRLVSQVGVRWSAHSTGTGKALLSALDETELMSLYEGEELTRYTDKTIIDLSALREDLRVARKRGYAIEAEENEIGVISIGSVIRGRDGGVIAAMSATGPIARITVRQIEDIGRLVREAADEASQFLGWEKYFVWVGGGNRAKAENYSY